MPGRGEPFECFFERAEPQLRRALVAAYGVELGRDAAGAALSYAWEHWDRVSGMKNPLGYLYRVGQSSTRRRKVPVVFARPDGHDPWVEPKLAEALAALSQRQRLAVVLVHGYGWRASEAAEVTGLRASTVETHARRGLARLRRTLEVDGDD